MPTFLSHGSYVSFQRGGSLFWPTFNCPGHLVGPRQSINDAATTLYALPQTPIKTGESAVVPQIGLFFMNATFLTRAFNLHNSPRRLLQPESFISAACCSLTSPLLCFTTPILVTPLHGYSIISHITSPLRDFFFECVHSSSLPINRA